MVHVDKEKQEKKNSFCNLKFKLIFFSACRESSGEQGWIVIFGSVAGEDLCV